jgi:hypothetical protein
MRVRYMWKYAAARTVTGTPTAIVNGVIIQNYPVDGNDWLKLLTEVSKQQYPKQADL